MKINFKYCSKGARAGNEQGQIPLLKGHFFIDTGSNFHNQILDHHHGSASYQSASEMVFKEFEIRIAKAVKEEHLNEITLVGHYDMDLDCAGGLYYIWEKFIHQGLDEKNWGTIVGIITDNGQGFTHSPVEHSIPVYFRAMTEILSSKIGGKKYPSNEIIADKAIDGFLLNKAFPFFDEILELISNGKGIHELCKDLSEVAYRGERRLIEIADTNYHDDLTRSKKILLRLPLQEGETYKEVDCSSNKDDMPRDYPMETKTKLVDGLILYNPKSLRYKEFARGDIQNSSLKKGFTLTIVHNDIESPGQHVISVTPGSGCSLQGLGKILEARERELEGERKRKNDKKRIYVKPGRHQYGVDDPGMTAGGISLPSSMFPG